MARDANRQEDSERERMAMELSRMISELNEVRMRLDSVVRKLAESSRADSDAEDGVETLERLRLALAAQLDRIRYKLVARMPEPN
jgi:hypothetical protein